MNKTELRNLIREEIKMVSEASIKLPKGYNIYRLGKNRYTFEYSEYGWEPSLRELQNVFKKMKSEWSNLISATKMQKSSTKEPVVYVRSGDVTFGLEFKTSDDLEKYGITVYDRD